jgi:hypothetical protein
MDTVIFKTPEGQDVEVEPLHFDAAFEAGLRPADAKEMGLWESFKTGLQRGAEMYTSTEMLGEMPEQASLEQAQAWQEHPIAYGAGVALPTVGIGLAAGGAAGYGGMKAKQQLQKAAPYIKPSIEAAKAQYKTTASNPLIPNVAWVGQPLAGAVAGTAAAVKQIPETRREAADLAKMSQAAPQPEAGAVAPRPQRLFLGQEVLDPGASPEKAAIAERAASIAGGNLRVAPLQQALEMGTTRRQEARNFLPQLAAEEIAPGLKSSFAALKKGKGEAYRPLYEKAAQEYQPEQGVAIPPRIGQLLDEAQGSEVVTSATKSALSATKSIIEEGKMRGLQKGAFFEIPSSEQYARLKKAREYLNFHISQVRDKKDPNIINQESLNTLKAAQTELDDVMKSIPSQAKADELYRESMKAKTAFYDAMEFGKGEKKTIDVPTLQRLFGNNAKAYRIQEGIETMRKFLDQYGQEIVPAKATEMRAVVDRFDALRKQAEDKRLLSGLQQAQGPTSPAFERTESLRRAQGLPADIFPAPASAMNAADEFIVPRSKAMFGKPFEQLEQPQKNTLIQLLVWRQQNPQASMLDEEAMFKKLTKTKGKK